MKIFLVSFLVAALAACATIYKPEVFDNGGGLYTLRLFVGTKGDKIYLDNFDRKARDLCGGDYKVLKQKHWDDGHMDWEIQCGK